MTLKEKLRGHFSEARSRIGNPQRILNSELISFRARALPLHSLNVFHCYIPIIQGDEVDTVKIIRFLHESNKRVCVPRIEGPGRMSARAYTPEAPLKINRYGIPEPGSDIPVVPEESIDLVFVPLLAFDTRGARLGYGGGFYDRLFAACRPDALWIGLSHLEASDTFLPQEPHDLKLNYALTPKNIYEF